MTNLTPTPGLDPVPQLERTTRALAGPGGPMNTQAQALLNRSVYLEEQVAEFKDLIGSTAGADSVGHLPSGPNAVPITVGGFIRLQKRSPDDYGAVGDGVTDDTASYQFTETAVGPGGVVYLPAGKVYALAAGTIPARAVEGPGQITIGGVVFNELMLKYDLLRTSLYFIPPNYSEVIGFPGGNGNMTIMISPGAKRTGNTNRSTFVGTQGPQQAINMDRCEGIGNGTLMFTEYAERATAVGTIAFQYLGCTDPAADGHGWWSNAGGFVPGDPGWNYQGMETRNPGIGAKIAAFTGYATQASDVGRSVAVGRDAFNGTPVATGSVALGYRAGAGCFSVSNVTLLGSDVFRDGVFITNSVGAGTFAGNNWQEGTRNSIYGYNAAALTVRGDANTLMGAFSGSDYTDLNGVIFIGVGAGNGLGGTSQSNILAIGTTGPNPLISGNISVPKVGVNIAPAKIKGTLHVRTNDFGAELPANASADDVVIENSTGCGMTIRSGVAGASNLLFADPDDDNVGGLVYNHSTNILTIRANAGDRWRIDNAALAPSADNVQSLGTAALRTSVVYSVTGAINVSDEREKELIGDIDDVALDAWASVDYQKFKFKDAIHLKSDGARWHYGVIAQRVQAAFQAFGVDAFEYGLLCYDEWDDQFEESPSGEMTKIVSAGNRYGVRYEEALCLEAALLRRTQKRLEARIKALEERP